MFSLVGFFVLLLFRRTIQLFSIDYKRLMKITATTKVIEIVKIWKV